MEWFKFQGNEYILSKSRRKLSLEEQAAWVLLLSFYSLKGEPVEITKDDMLFLTGTDKPFLQKFSNLGMIEIDKKGIVTVLSWEKRQSRLMTRAEYMRMYREKKAEEERRKKSTNRQTESESTDNDKTSESEPLQEAISGNKANNIPIDLLMTVVLNNFTKVFHLSRPTDRKVNEESEKFINEFAKFIKDMGKDPTDIEKMSTNIGNYMSWIASQDWGENVQTISCLTRKIPAYQKFIEEQTN